MYHFVFLTALILCTGYGIALHPLHSTRSSSQAILKQADYHFRSAVKEDVDDITTVIIDAFSPSPLWHYARPEYHKYKDYTWHCLRDALSQQMANIDRASYSLNVVAIPDSTVSGGRNERVVALGNWVPMTSNRTTTSATDSFIRSLTIGLPIWSSQRNINYGSPKYNCSAQLDMNKTRAADFSRQFDPAETQYIDEAYPKQFYLGILATHPDWDGHGFAALNLHWGTEMAKTLEEPATLIATPAGYPLYDNFGFRSLKNISIKTLDGWGGGSLWYEVMEYP